MSSSLSRPCSNSTIAHYPDVCPSDRVDLGSREDVVVNSQLFLDDASEPWIAYLVGTVAETCAWGADGAGCFETLPCTCRQRVSHSGVIEALAVAQVQGPSRSVRVELSTLASYLAIGASSEGFRVAVWNGSIVHAMLIRM